MKKARDEWAIWQKEPDKGQLVFLDESGVRTNISATYGWAKKGKRCVGKAPGGWKSYTMLSAISKDEVLESLLIDGALDKPTFKYFMEDVLLKNLKRGSIVIMDNLSVHKDSFDIKKFIKKGILIKYLPPYSPDLNPIENMWSKIKFIIRKINPRNFDEIWNAMNQALWKVTPENLCGWFKKCGYLH